MANVAKTFSLSPLQVARELDEDPEHTALEALVLLNYADAKRAYDAVGGNPKKLRGMSENMTATLTKNTWDLQLLARDHHAGHPEMPGQDCWLCL